MAPVPAFLDGIGLSEMLVIGFIAILIFGGNLPDALRNLGRSYAKFRKSLHDVSRPLRDEIQRATTLPVEAYTPTLPANASASPLPPSPLQASDPGAPAAHEAGMPLPPAAAQAAPPVPAGPAPSAPGPPLSRPVPFDDEPPPV